MEKMDFKQAFSSKEGQIQAPACDISAEARVYAVADTSYRHKYLTLHHSYAREGPQRQYLVDVVHKVSEQLRSFL